MPLLLLLLMSFDAKVKEQRETSDSTKGVGGFSTVKPQQVVVVTLYMN